MAPVLMTTAVLELHDGDALAERPHGRLVGDRPKRQHGLQVVETGRASEQETPAGVDLGAGPACSPAARSAPHW